MTQPPEQPEFELPPLPVPGPEERDRLSRQPRIVVRAFVIEGSTVFTQEQLQEITEPYRGRPISSEELHALRDRLKHVEGTIRTRILY